MLKADELYHTDLSDEARHWLRRFCRLRALAAAREQPTCVLSSMPSSIYSAPVVSGGCCHMTFQLGVRSTIISEVGMMPGYGYNCIAPSTRRFESLPGAKLVPVL